MFPVTFIFCHSYSFQCIIGAIWPLNSYPYVLSISKATLYPTMRCSTPKKSLEKKQTKHFPLPFTKQILSNCTVERFELNKRETEIANPPNQKASSLLLDGYSSRLKRILKSISSNVSQLVRVGDDKGHYCHVCIKKARNTEVLCFRTIFIPCKHVGRCVLVCIFPTQWASCYM